MKLEEQQRKWFVLHTRSRFENVVNDGLAKKSIEVFLPKILVRSKRRDRKLLIRVPVFPGYLFVKSDMHPNEQIEIVKTIGVVRFIGTKDGPVPVADETIDSLKIMVNSESQITTGNRLVRGDKVIVVNGPFAGVIGTFVTHKGRGRIVINVEALGQTASVEVDEADIEPLPKIPA
jgi:transcription elongation factor/antiterminator RfaH